MDVINRLRNVVTNVLPVGNPITNDYEIHAQKASGGPGMLWKIYDAVDKSTKQDVSIFILEKKLLERFSRTITERIIDLFKRGVSQLTKLRHPKILSVVHPLEDSKESLAFATEQIFSSLTNILQFHDNLPSPPPSYLKHFEFYDVEIRYGLLQIAEALTFLHNSAHIVHGNCCPEAIYVNKFGTWKLAGFEFCILSSNTDGNPYYPLREYDTRLDPILQAKLNYLAPEYGLSGFCDTASDMYSVAILMGALYNKGKTIYDCMGDWQNYKRNVAELRNLKASQVEGVPDSMKGTIRLLLNVEPTIRPDAFQFSKLPYFEDVGVMTLTYLDLLVQKDNLQKSQFFKGLPPIIIKLPLRVNLQRVIPSLSKECSVANMVPFILPTIFEVVKQASKAEYIQFIFPSLVPLFRIEEPIQVMLIFLQNMSIVLNKTPQSDICNHVLPMISRALDATMPQLRDLCLNIIPSFAGLVEQSSLKNAIIPKILKIYVQPLPLGTRVNSLVCLGQILEHLDKWYILDEVFPVIKSLPCKEPAILMSILGIYRITLNHKKLGIPKETIANQIIPFLFPYCIENALNITQFNTLMSVINDMISKVEGEQRKKLEQLDQVEQENKTLQKLAKESMDSSTTGDNALQSDSEMFDFFKTIGYDSSNDVIKSQPNEAIPKNQFTKPADLTMQEKSTLAQHQELMNRMKTDQLQPKPVMQINDITKPKDLTSSLIDSNLSKLQLTNQNPAKNQLSNHNSARNQPTNQNQALIQPNYTGFSSNSDFTSFHASSKPINFSPFDNLNVISKQNNSSQLNQICVQSSNKNNSFNLSNNAAPLTFQTTNASNSSFGAFQNSSVNLIPNTQNFMPKFQTPNPFRQPYIPMNNSSSGTLPTANQAQNIQQNFMKPSNAAISMLNNKDIDDLLG